MTGDRRPYLHELSISLLAPSVAMSDRAGQIRPAEAHGVYVSDRRRLSTAILTVDGEEPDAVVEQSDGSGRTHFLAVVRGLGDPGPDPSVFAERDREVTSDGAVERHTLRNRSRHAVSARVTLTVAADHLDMATVKRGQIASTTAPVEVDGALWWADADGASTTVTAHPPAHQIDVTDGTLSWLVDLAPAASWTVEISVSGTDPVRPVALAAHGPSVISRPIVDGVDPRLVELVERSVADLRALEMSDPLAPDDHFLAAGAPWFLTLFGRDSLWAARMLLPLGTELAAGTLRTLARRQGTRLDPSRAEEPGKILHEIRSEASDHGRREGAAGDVDLRLPALYYGTVDATPLWISLLHDAWRWGLPSGEVEALLPALEAALGWLAETARAGGGFLRYSDASGHGLANQGWKDNFDAVHYADGRLAEPPIALVEVQGYAFAAARAAADLLDAFHRPGADQWRAWAAELRQRFRGAFWAEDDVGPYPAIALDGAGRPVDIVTSNMGHLLSTGLLDRHETRLVVSRLASPELDSGFGLRTLATSATRYNPLSYHCGSVWTHDTAITVAGLGAAGTAQARAVAARYIDGLLSAAASFDFRLPELFGGQPNVPGQRPVPYPTSCRPQAWSAASSIVILTTLLGLRADVPGGALHLEPLDSATAAPQTLQVRGLRVGGERLDIAASAEGGIQCPGVPLGVTVEGADGR